MLAVMLTLWSWVALAGGELVIVLDNSGSMPWGGVDAATGVQAPPNDPERVAVLGAQVVEGLAKGSSDALTLVVFDKGGKKGTKITASQLRTLEYAGGTPLKSTVAATRSIFEQSTREPKVMVLLSDGSPTDASRPAEMQGLVPNDVDVIGISYFRDAKARTLGEAFLKPLILDEDDLTAVDPGRPDVVVQTIDAFTTGYARVLGSRPDTGVLQPGQSHTFQAGRFVEEVLVAVAARDVGKIGAVKLSGPRGAIPIGASGDNGCEINWANEPKHCTGYRRSFATFRSPHDPEKPGSYTLELPSGATPAAYGVILRYGLTPVLTAPPVAQMGEQITVKAHLQSRGKLVDAPEILDSPNFQVVLQIGSQQVPMTHEGGGKFTATFSPAEPGNGMAEVAFQNDWLDLRTKAPMSIQGFAELALNVPPVDLGSWSGGRWASEQCQPLDLSNSKGADVVPLVCEAAEPLSCSKTGAGWQVCARAPGCCGAMPDAGQATSVVLKGKHPHYASGAVTIPVAYEVSATGLLRCWWVEIIVVIGLTLFVFVVYGFIKPFGFDPAISVKIAGREAALRRATATVLAESPGGRRGWYRNARFGLTNDGTPTRKKAQAQLLLEAGPRRKVILRNGAGLEVQDRRTRKWQPVEMGTEILPGSTYRIGNMYLKFS